MAGRRRRTARWDAPRRSLATADKLTVVTAHASLDASGVVAEAVLEGRDAEQRNALLQRSRETLLEHGIEPTLMVRDGDPAER
jgi:hypothetical protein